LWELNKKDVTDFTLITSEYWLKDEEFEKLEFQGECMLPAEDENS
jgi:hypothetical protein